MKLAALGVVAMGVGVALTEPGLIGIGAFWVLMGLLARVHGQRLKELQAQNKAEDEKAKPAIDGRTFALGTALWLGLGLPSLAVGLFEIGISAEHEDWRWLPIVVGGFALGIGVVSAMLYLLGGAALKVAERGPAKTVPATVRIRAMRETGTYINERPRLEFELTVEPEPASGVASYEVTKKATVPFTAMGSLRVGDGFRARVAGPEEPTAMDIFWDEPVSATAASGAEDTDVSTRLDELDRLHRESKISDEEYQAQRGRILGSL
ncbi:MAG: hypothetical protein J7518_13005 [Nocardioidaceae bacterium]|nr:hypothetical protein [Nocardioidaceae bacterium]